MSLQTKTPGAGKQPGVTIESGRRNFTASHIARGIACGLLVSASAIFTGVSLTRCTSHTSHGTITPAPVNPALVFSDTKSEAVATPTDKRGFITPIHKAGSGTPTASRYGYGRDALTRKDSGTASDVCLTSRPPFALRPAAGGLFNIPEGI